MLQSCGLLIQKDVDQDEKLLWGRVRTDLFKKNYLKEESRGLWERVYVARNEVFLKEQTHLFIKEGTLY